LGDELIENRVGEFDQRKEALYREIIRRDFPAMEGAEELVARLAADRFLLAVGSSGPPENVALVMEKLRGSEHISVTVTGQDVTRGKPDPQVFQIAAERLGVPANSCAVVEDAIHGVEAAQRAGMAAIALTGTLARDELAVADLVVDRLQELTPSTVRDLIARIH
jgi:beta-phosphoglucomutase